MTNKKSTFTVLTTLTALVGLTALITTASLIPTSQVQARPLSEPRLNTPVYTPVIPASRLQGQAPVYTPAQHYRSIIQGKLNSNNPGSSQVACSQITVKLNESIPVQQGSGPFGTSPTIDLLSQVIATGSNLASGCTYTMTYAGDGKPVKNAYGYSSYNIGATTPGDFSSGFWGGGNSFKEIPSVSDLSIKYNQLR
jgi:hypothetical protein